MERMRRRPSGFLLVTGLMVLTGLLTLTSLGLTRSLTDLRSANVMIDQTQAFQLAEGGVDVAIRELSLAIPSAIDTILRGADNTPNTTDDGRLALVTTPLGSYTITVTDNTDGDNNLFLDADGIVIVRSRGDVGGLQPVTISATLDLPGNPFQNALMACAVRFQDNARLGNSFDTDLPVLLNFSLETELSNRMYATDLYFTSNPGSCNHCSNPIVYPNAPTIHGGQNPLQARAKNSLLDLRPYYDVAIEQCVAENPAAPGRLAACTNGTANSVHHITADTMLNNTTINGIIYVERGVNLDLQGNVQINGTIVHEGYNHQGALASSPAQALNFGRIKLLTGAHLTIDSTTGAPFAPGVAMVSGAIFRTSSATTTDVTGYMMVGGGGPELGYSPESRFLGSGQVSGGILTSYGLSYQLASGPGTEGPARIAAAGGGFGPINWAVAPGVDWNGFNEMDDDGVGDNIELLFVPPSQQPPGFGGGTQVLEWHVE